MLCERSVERAERLRREKRYREGIDLLVEALKYGEEKTLIYFRLGNLYFDGGDLARAEYAYKRAIEEDPRHTSAHHNLGVVYRRQNRVSESVRYLKKARRLELRHPRGGKLTSEQRKAGKKVLLPVAAAPALVLVVIIIIVFLLSRLT